MLIPDSVPPLRPRPVDAHKGSMGKLLIVGGASGLTGAPTLTAHAALRSGVGLVTIACPASLNPILEIKNTESMTLPLADSGTGAWGTDALATLQPALERADAAVIGPGLGRHANTAAAFPDLVQGLRLPHVLDADGLWHLANCGDFAPSDQRVLTPHAGELSRLMKTDSLERPQVESWLEPRGGVLVWKGPKTLVLESRKCYQNTSGNAGLATGGTGDVLAGVIGAFLARGDSPWAAAVRGVWLHGRAADLAAASLGQESLIASDVIHWLPAAIQELQKSQAPGQQHQPE